MCAAPKSGQRSWSTCTPSRVHIPDGGLGHISEIFDGDAPQLPRGCIAQAWSVAEILRAYIEDVKNISPEPTIESQPTQASAQLKDRSAARAVREVSMTRTGA